MSDLDLQLPKIDLKKYFWEDLFSEQRRKASIIFLSLMILFFVCGTMLPKISYEDFCKNSVEDLKIMKKTYNSPAEVFKINLCKAETQEQRFGVEYILYIFYVGLKMFCWFLSGFMLFYFLRRDRFFVAESILMANSLFIWVVAIIIYVSTYTGWF